MERPVLQMHVWQTNQPESFWFHANQRPLFCLDIPALTASLGSVTDIFSYNWFCTYTNDFPPRLKTSMWANWRPWLACSECLTFYMTRPPEWPLFGGWEKQVTAVGWATTSVVFAGWWHNRVDRPFLSCSDALVATVNVWFSAYMGARERAVSDNSGKFSQ